MRVALEAPCSKCGKSDWCSVSRDGVYAICRRVNDGSGRGKVDRGGGEYWVYRLRGEATLAARPWPAKVAPAALPTSAHLHRVYSAILEVLTLAEVDRDQLRSRGLNEDHIQRNQYRTFGAYDRRRALARALRLYGEAACLTVPGVILRRENRDSYVCLAGAPGLIVPVRNLGGEIIALKVRRRVAASPRYLYVSSVATGGPGPGAPVHVPSAGDRSTTVVRLTEGELKADVATALSGLLTISVAGAGTWRRALPVLKELGARTCRLAFDADGLTNRHVATALLSLAEHLVGEGLEVELETWEESLKGIDDCLAAGRPIARWVGEAALTECRRRLELTAPAARRSA
jgi:hypothetical protein